MADYSQLKALSGNGGGKRRRFQQISRDVSAIIGTEFFRLLVKHLGHALDADCIYIGEFVGGDIERVRALAVYLDGEPLDSFEFPLAGSPDSEVAIGNPCIFSKGVQEFFPLDDRLSELKAEACVGLPLTDAEGRPVGLIAALYRRPLDDDLHFVQSMLARFVPRASAELNRKQADDALRESEQRHRAFIMLNTDAMWRVEFENPIATSLPEEQQMERIFRSAYVAECNPAWARLLGVDKVETLIGSRISELVKRQPEYHRYTQESIRAFIRSGYQFSGVEASPIDYAGNPRYLLRSLWGIVEDGALQRVWGTSRDITELRRSELALASAERRLTDLLESLHLVAIILDRDETVSFCNNYMLKLTGWGAEEIAGKNWLDLMIPADEREKLRAAFSAADSGSPGPAHVAATLLARDGHRRSIAWDSIVLRDASGAVTGSAAVGRDITEFKALEEQFRQAQKLESIGRLAGGVAHDFNNLLTIIRGYSALLLDGRDHKDPAYIGLVEIIRAAEKGAALTNQLLTFSRKQLPQPRVLNLNSVISEEEVMLRRILGDDIVLTTDLNQSPGFVLADDSHIRQVIMNLAVNARDAMPRGGKLILALANLDLGEDRAPRLSAIPVGHYVHLIVADTGVGMSDDVRAHLFEPFFTTKDIGKGTGLGLSTVYGIVAQSGGYIIVESEPGKGSTFEIFLPRVPPPVETSPQGDEVQPALRGGNETVLIVEDQQEVRSLLVTLLRQWGYTVLEAEDGKKALRLFNRRRPIHLVVTDLVMPGMSGIEFVELARARSAKTKVLYISGYSGGTYNEKAVKDPVFEYLQKPFPTEVFVRRVRELLDQT